MFCVLVIIKVMQFVFLSTTEWALLGQILKWVKMEEMRYADD